MARSADSITSEQRSSPDNRSLGELFAELSKETTTLVRQEIDLAKTEMSQKAVTAGKDLGFLAAGGAVAYAGLLALIAAVIIGLGQLGLTWWISALTVGAVVAGVGGYLVFKGITELKNTSVLPKQTLETLQEDQQWAKHRTS